MCSITDKFGCNNTLRGNPWDKQFQAKNSVAMMVKELDDFKASLTPFHIHISALNLTFPIYFDPDTCTDGDYGAGPTKKCRFSFGDGKGWLYLGQNPCFVTDDGDSECYYKVPDFGWGE
jgi:hypothetical protein